MKINLMTIPNFGKFYSFFGNEDCYPDDWDCKPKGGGGPCGPGTDCYPSNCTPDRTNCNPDYCNPDKCFPEK